MAENPTTAGWPQTPDGQIDWETVFEHPDTGFIPLIMQAPSAAALRKSTVFVIRAIYGDEESAGEVEGFVAEINGMLPDEVPVEMLPKLSEAVASILRDIKVDRIRRSEAPPLPPDPPKKRVPPRGAIKRKPKRGIAPAQIIAAVMFAAVILGGGGYGTYFYFFMEHGDSDALRAKRLIVQMEAAADGAGPEQHEFGWPLTVERRAGLIGVTATGLPVHACLSAAWHFVNRQDSNIIINDRMPERVGPSILERFCEERGRTAKLLWLSKDPNAQAVDQAETQTETQTETQGDNQSSNQGEGQTE